LATPGNSLFVGYPRTSEWNPISVEELEVLDLEYYYLRCESETKVKDTIRVFPKLSNPIVSPLVPDIKGVQNVMVMVFDAYSRET
jgi:hypothetical protein